MSAVTTIYSIKDLIEGSLSEQIFYRVYGRFCQTKSFLKFNFLCLHYLYFLFTDKNKIFTYFVDKVAYALQFLDLHMAYLFSFHYMPWMCIENLLSLLCNRLYFEQLHASKIALKKRATLDARIPLGEKMLSLYAIFLLG